MSKSSSLKATLGCVCLSLALAHAAQAQSDVTQPGDPIYASSGNGPTTEAVANAIDNTQAKYLNFDSASNHNPPNAPSGFAVSPSVGVTRVIGMTITSANDAPERDPKTVLLEGSNDDTILGYTNVANWVTIVGITNIEAFTNRFEKQTFFFDNFTAYRHYRWTVLEVQTDNTCCMQVAEVELLGGTLPPDVTQPGDPIFASSGNGPTTEAVANAIDNTQAKYLNFDSASNHNPPDAPSGFAVTPSIGASLVTGMTITSANDAPERDPKTVLLEGSNDNIVGYTNVANWVTVVGVTNIPAFTSRFQKQTFLFDNYTPYKSYRWTVLAVQTDNTCCMQVAEVELLGTSAPKDVTQPGDTIYASSGNGPTTEAVANAIDNTQAKYLNFDSASNHNPPNAPSGFAVAPSIGASTVIGMTITSANDAPERDPKTVLLEGSNDATLLGYTNAANWVTIVGITNIDAFTNRFETQAFYFANKQSYKFYRWTVLAVQTDNTCCMQVAEVELLAATASNPCGQTAFLETPVSTPALVGTPATFFSKVNGPWALQWYQNGVAIPGATKSSYSTAPLTAINITNQYSVAIAGCQTSSVVQASIFVPSATKSLAINFGGRGANGAPTYVLPEEIIGVQPQAYWNNATNRTDVDINTGITGDSVGLADAVTNSDGLATTITFEYAANGAWGSGVGTETPTDRMLNGLVGRGGAPDGTTINNYIFHNVPDSVTGHAILIYAVSPPLQIQTIAYAVTGGNPTQTTPTNYIRVMNSDEYKPAPGFYRGNSTNPLNAPIANFVRFDGIHPDVNGDITLSIQNIAGNGNDRESGVNGLQLVLNAPNPGSPPTITANPQPTVAPLGGVASLSVTASGSGLTYQWRKNGVSVPNGGHISGATTSTLSISSFTNTDEGVYSVAVFSPAGSVVSKNASVRLSTYNINDALVGYWPLDPTTGTVAPNSVAGGQVGVVNGTATWVAGQITNAFSFDGGTYLVVTNYPKATTRLSASAWVKVDPAIGASVTFLSNGDGPVRQDALRGITGQFEIGLVQDAIDPSIYRLRAAIMIGNGQVVVMAPNAFTLGSWQQIAFSADGAQLHLYANGAEVAQTDYAGSFATVIGAQHLSMGATLSYDISDPLNPVLGLDGTPNFMTGPMDDVALWNRNLTLTEVSTIYAQGLLKKPVNSVTETPPLQTPVISAPAVTGGVISFTWSNGGTLETAPTPNGAWTTTGNSSGSFSEPVAAGNKYYRVKR